MIRAVRQFSREEAPTGETAIFHLDNPGPAGPIAITSTRPNSELTVVYALSDTAEGVGATSGSTTAAVSLATTAGKSLVIAHHGNGFDIGNTGSAATADPPLTQVASWVKTPGNPWTGGGAGHQLVDAPGTVTPTFSNVGSGNYATVAAEFLAAPPKATLIAVR